MKLQKSKEKLAVWHLLLNSWYRLRAALMRACAVPRRITLADDRSQLTSWLKEEWYCSFLCEYIIFEQWQKSMCIAQSSKRNARIISYANFETKKHENLNKFRQVSLWMYGIIMIQMVSVYIYILYTYIYVSLYYINICVVLSEYIGVSTLRQYTWSRCFIPRINISLLKIYILCWNGVILMKAAADVRLLRINFVVGRGRIRAVFQARTSTQVTPHTPANQFDSFSTWPNSSGAGQIIWIHRL